jgi:putative iron-regulated protein
MKMNWNKKIVTTIALVIFSNCEGFGFREDKKNNNQLIAAAYLYLTNAKPTVSKQDMVNTYVDIAFANYSDSITSASALKTAIETFIGTASVDIASPSQTNMDAAKKAWIDARPSYLQTEVFRFAKGPIDDKLESRKSDAGIETLINAWPMDELFVDCFITNTTNANLTEANILNANTSIATTNCTSFTSADKNITVGWHAIEYLLWGQDTSSTTGGSRVLSDFTGSTGTTAEKRRTYLRVTAKLLVDHLTLVRDKWDTSKTGNTATSFKSDVSGSLTNIFTGLAAFTKSEWGSQRLNMITSNDQEDEHSCFSDNTKADFYYDAQGFINVYSGTYKKTSGTTYSGAGLKNLAGSLDSSITTNMNLSRDNFCLNVSGASMIVDSTSCASNTISGKYDQLISTGTASSQMTTLKSVQTAIITIATNIQTVAKNNGISFTAPTSIQE